MARDLPNISEDAEWCKKNWHNFSFYESENKWVKFCHQQHAQQTYAKLSDLLFYQQNNDSRDLYDWIPAWYFRIQSNIYEGFVTFYPIHFGHLKCGTH